MNNKKTGKLTCVQSGEGLPLPTITCQLLESHTEYSLLTFALNEINCTITMAKSDHSNTTLECVSGHTNGAKGDSSSFHCVFVIHSGHRRLTYCFCDNLFPLITDVKTMLLGLIKQPEIISAFLSGVLLTTVISTIVCCLMSKCHR